MLSVCLEVFHKTLCFFMWCTIAVIIETCLVCHHNDALLKQPIEALLQCGVHIRYSGCKTLGIETKTIHCHFLFFGKFVLFAFFDVVHCREILMIYFSSLCSVLYSVWTAWDLQMLYRTDEQATSNAFFGKLLFRRKEEFYKNALQSDGIKRGSPPSRLENQPARTGMDRIRNKIKRRKLIGINGGGWRRGIGR